MKTLFVIIISGLLSGLAQAEFFEQTDSPQDLVWECKAVGYVRNTGNARFVLGEKSEDMNQATNSALKKCQDELLLACEFADCRHIAQ